MAEISPNKYLTASGALSVYYFFLYRTTGGTLRHGAIRDAAIEFGESKRTVLRDLANNYGHNIDVPMALRKSYKGKVVCPTTF